MLVCYLLAHAQLTLAASYSPYLKHVFYNLVNTKFLVGVFLVGVSLVSVSLVCVSLVGVSLVGVSLVGVSLEGVSNLGGFVS